MVKRRHIVLTIILVLLLLGSNVQAAVLLEGQDAHSRHRAMISNSERDSIRYGLVDNGQYGSSVTIADVEWMLGLFPEQDHDNLTILLLDKPMAEVWGTCWIRGAEYTIILSSDAGIDTLLHEYGHYMDKWQSETYMYRKTLKKHPNPQYSLRTGIDESFAEDFKEYILFSTRKVGWRSFIPRKKGIYSFNWDTIRYFDKKFPHIYQMRMEYNKGQEPLLIEQEW